MKDPLLDRILQSKWFNSLKVCFLGFLDILTVCFLGFLGLANLWQFIKGLFTGVVYFQYEDSPELYIPWESHPQVYLVWMFVYFICGGLPLVCAIYWAKNKLFSNWS